MKRLLKFVQNIITAERPLSFARLQNALYAFQFEKEK